MIRMRISIQRLISKAGEVHMKGGGAQFFFSFALCDWSGTENTVVMRGCVGDKGDAYMYTYV